VAPWERGAWSFLPFAGERAGARRLVLLPRDGRFLAEPRPRPGPDLDRAAEVGIGERCVFVARSLMPIRPIRLPATHGENYWELTADPGPAPRFWRTPIAARSCAACGCPMPGRHHQTLYCGRRCKRAAAILRRRGNA
jgi:hypothetical protein